ncbi:hypothetical protein [Streptomyces sp. NBC_00829]|uniref:hypothetical protein n=1 Tax=Streptomyces sp. NBC_00829 TaxID=2903679 RepID=UPI00386C7DB4|nr:hypothetical protein OG293_26395 [Streptomyces sp. NBC_00829]
MGGPRVNGIARTARPMALLSAVATLLSALFICVSLPSGHHAPASAADGDTVTVYSCPYDDGGCGLLPTVSPAVLTAPPLDSPLDAAEQPARPGQTDSAGAPPRSQAQPRAPGLHVLQVLRT